jgi:hypothetical protein
MDRKVYLDKKQMIFQSSSKGVFTLKITRAATEANASTLDIIKTVIETKGLLNSSTSMEASGDTTFDIVVSIRITRP